MTEWKEDWNELIVDPQIYTKSLALPDPARLRIYDTTLRDGEQMPGVAMSAEQKYIIAKELSALGCHVLDLGFPAVSESERQALQLVLEGKHRGEIRDDVELLVMCRASTNDIDMTIETITSLGYSLDEVTFLIFTSASPLHCKYKIGSVLLRREGLSPRDLPELPLSFFHQTNKRLVKDLISYARERGVASIEFGTEDASRTSIDQLIDLVRVAIEAGARRYIFPDTTGSLTPEATRFYCQALSVAFPQTELASHFHNDFGLATANVITGVLSGFTTFSTTVNGIGERAGNAPLHSVVVGLKYLYGLEIPGFQYDRLCHVKRMVEEITGVPVQAQEPVVGYNVFSHESGIHTHGVSISHRIYEAIPYEEVGGESKIVYGKHSGCSTLLNLLQSRAAEFDGPVDKEFALVVLEEIKRLRERASYQSNTSANVKNYYAALGQLGMGEDEVIHCANRIASAALLTKGESA